MDGSKSREIRYGPGRMTICYDDGHKMSEGPYIDGKEEGKWTTWYRSGEVECEKLYKNGERYRKQAYYKSGRKRAEIGFRGFKRQGKSVHWYENGQKRSEGSYENGRRTGKWTYWHENGKKKSEGMYEDGRRQGKWVSWHANGRKESEGWYEDGEKKGE